MKLLSILFSLTLIGNPSLLDIRHHFQQAAESAESAQELFNKLADVDKNDSKILVAYKGAALTLIAKFSRQKEEKKQNFITGVEWIEHAIEQAPENAEIRFIRLSIQENTPPFLRYKKNIVEDKNFILGQFSGIESDDLKQKIRTYITHSSIFSEAEKQSINH